MVRPNSKMAMFHRKKFRGSDRELSHQFNKKAITECIQNLTCKTNIFRDDSRYLSQIARNTLKVFKEINLAKI
jgi:hypothetical protein